jgi:hypothetical protein
MRDLPSGHADTDAVLAANAQRESAFLLKIKAIATPADGLAALLDAADQSTIAVAAKHAAGSNAAANAAKAGGQDKEKEKDKAKGNGGNPKGSTQPEKKK